MWFQSISQTQNQSIWPLARRISSLNLGIELASGSHVYGSSHLNDVQFGGKEETYLDDKINHCLLWHFNVGAWAPDEVNQISIAAGLAFDAIQVTIFKVVTTKLFFCGCDVAAFAFQTKFTQVTNDRTYNDPLCRCHVAIGSIEILPISASLLWMKI